MSSGPPARHRVLVAAFGDAGHAFPAIALALALKRRGHEVVVETWDKWRPKVEAEGLEFAAAPEYDVFPTRELRFKPYLAAVQAARTTRALLRDLHPDCVVTDILTLAPALSAELEGIPWASLVPHVYPPAGSGLPPYGLGAQPPRTAAGGRLWDRLAAASDVSLRRGRRELNEARRMLGLPPVDRLWGGLSTRLCLVATFPQLEYPRTWPDHVHVTGPLLWEPAAAADIEPLAGDVPLAGDEPLVIVAPSTTQDRGQRLLLGACDALAGEAVRILAIGSSDALAKRARQNPRLECANWVTYSRIMRRADVVVCHAGHGTLAHALTAGAAVAASPAGGDMSENAARLVWSGAGLRFRRRFAGPRTIRRIVRRLLDEPRFHERARQFRQWADGHESAQHAATLVEELMEGACAPTQPSLAP